MSFSPAAIESVTVRDDERCFAKLSRNPYITVEYFENFAGELTKIIDELRAEIKRLQSRTMML